MKFKPDIMSAERKVIRLYMNTDFTQYGLSALEELNRTILSFYSRDEIVAKLKEYNEATGTERDTLRRNLRDIFNVRNFDFDAFEKLDDAKKVADEIPDRRELVKNFLRVIYEKFFVSFPTGQQLMGRVIDKRDYPHDKRNFKPNDSLRLEILKIFCNSPLHFEPLEQYVLSKIPAAQTAYNAIATSVEKISFVQANLNEDVFTLLFDHVGWANFLERRSRDSRLLQENFFLTNKVYFNLADDTRHLLERVCDDKATANERAQAKKILPELENIFCDEYLSRLYVVEDNGQMGISRRKLYKTAKADLLIEKNCVLDVLGTLGKTFFNVNEFVEFFLEINNDFEFPEDSPLRRGYIRNFRLQADSLTPAKDLFDVVSNGRFKFNLSAERRQLLESIEREIFKTVSKAEFMLVKTDKLLALHGVEVRSFLRQNVPAGQSCGLDMVTWTKLFLEQLDTSQLSPLPATNFQPQSDTEAKNSHKAIIAHLKQFARPGNRDLPTYGHAFQAAWKNHVNDIPQKPVLQTADDLANLHFDFQRSTKKSLYQFALLLDLGDDPTGTFEKILNDVYTDNFLSSSGELSFDSAIMSEGINWKSYVETIYLYFMNKQDLTPGERLKVAEEMIARCSNKPQNVQTRPLAEFTAAYQVNFFENLLRLNPKEFEQQLTNGNYILSDELPTMNSARQGFNELIARIEKEISTRDRDCGLDIRAFVEEQFPNDEELAKMLSDKRFVAIFERMEKTLNIYERGLINRLRINPNFYSRTDLMALFYLYFVRVVLPEFIISGEIVDWETLFNDQFIPDLNEYLEKCRYKTFSVKSPFDNYLLFSMFAHVLEEQLGT